MKLFSIFSVSTAYLLTVIQAQSNVTPRLIGSGHLDHHSFHARAPLGNTFSGTNLIIDPNGELANQVTGILYKNGFQTYCEVAVSNQNTGIMAASCLDYTNGKVDESVSYGVAVSTTTPSQPGQVLTVGTPIIHPSYNPSTYANNIAVLPLSATNQVDIAKNIDDWPHGWAYYLLNHRSVNNNYLDSITFQRPISTAGKESDQDTQACTSASAIFSDNQSDFVCNSATIASYLNANCSAPYGSIYGVTGERGLNIGGIFSHSAIYSDQGYCGQGKIYNYYLLFRNYMPWIQSVAKGTIGTYHSQSATGYTVPNNASYTMNDSGENVTGVALVGNYTTGQAPAAAESHAQSRAQLPEGSSSEEQSQINDITSVEDTTEATTDIVSSTYIASSTEIDSTTATISETTTIDTTKIVSQTSIAQATSTVLVTSTSVQIEMTTVTDTEVVPTVIGATNSIISAVIVSVTDVSILTVGSGQVATQTVTSTDTVTVSAGNAGVVTVGGETMTVTETVTAATNTVYVTSVVTESASAVTSVSTATFTDYDFITVYTTDTSVSTVTVVSTGSIGTPTSVTSPSSIQPSSAASEPSSAESSGSDADSQKDDKGVPMWMIAMIAILGILFLILLVWFILYRRRRQREKEQEDMLAFGAPRQLPQEHRVINWFNDKIWGRPLSGKGLPPDYSSTINQHL